MIEVDKELTPFNEGIAKDLPKGITMVILACLRHNQQKHDPDESEGNQTAQIILASVYGGLCQAMVQITPDEDVEDMLKELPDMLHRISKMCIPIKTSDAGEAANKRKLLQSIMSEKGLKKLSGDKAKQYVERRLREELGSTKTFSDEEETFLK